MREFLVKTNRLLSTTTNLNDPEKTCLDEHCSDSRDLTMAELALAIVPLCIGAIKGADIIRKRLKILRHHNNEIKRLRTKFTTQNNVFLDECQLLLQEILEPKEAESCKQH